MRVEGPRKLRYVHEAACSLNLSQTALDWLLPFGFVFNRLFDPWEQAIGIRLGLHDPSTHHQFWPPAHLLFWIRAIPLTLSLWLILRLASRLEVAQRFLRTGAGLTALFASPAMRVYMMAQGYARSDPGLWIVEAACEVLLVGVLFFGFLRGRWRVPYVVLAGALILHAAFWFGIRESFFYGSAAAPIGLVAGLVWLYYLRLSGGPPGHGDERLRT